MGRLGLWVALLNQVVLMVMVNPALANWMYLGMLGASVPSDGPKNYDSPRSDQPAHPGSSICSSVPGLVTKQKDVCEEQPSSMNAVIVGIRRGILECQQQFQNERWNCTPEGDENVFGYTLNRAVGMVIVRKKINTRSTFTIVLLKTRNKLVAMKITMRGKASNGPSSHNCQPVHAPDGGNSHQKEKYLPSQAITRHMQRKCRCHGVSGSCELKTCWRKLPSFVEVGNRLKKKYEDSVLISMKARKRLRRRGKRKVPVRKDDLVYINKSPNYCVEDPANGIFGTSGRLCNKTSAGPDGCNLLCCGRGYNTQVITHVERCHCKFHWCCYVTCRNCTTEMEIYTCK
ncbi:protein Wnt-16-like [Limulus polyphemus]|uniref:Protein Wnt n=1 Tax=Limulus polyphemus TaxID=6850 RepID=A0ABM1SF11_LIMPO|nr:protein Wnt-16-like [Limulus polyphemus]